MKNKTQATWKNNPARLQGSSFLEWLELRFCPHIRSQAGGFLLKNKPFKDNLKNKPLKDWKLFVGKLPVFERLGGSSKNGHLCSSHDRVVGKATTRYTLSSCKLPLFGFGFGALHRSLVL